MNDYLQVLRIIQFCLSVALGLQIPETSRFMILNLKEKIDFEINMVNNEYCPF